MILKDGCVVVEKGEFVFRVTEKSVRPSRMIDVVNRSRQQRTHLVRVCQQIFTTLSAEEIRRGLKITLESYRKMLSKIL